MTAMQRVDRSIVSCWLSFFVLGFAHSSLPMSSAGGNLLVAAMDPLPPYCVGVLVAVQSYSGESRAARAQEILRLAHGIKVGLDDLEHIYSKIDSCCPEIFRGRIYIFVTLIVIFALLVCRHHHARNHFQPACKNVALCFSLRPLRWVTGIETQAASIH